MKLLCTLVASLVVGGCANFSGLESSNSFGCKAPAGVSCQSISGVQANAAQGNLPFQKEDPAKTFGTGDQRVSDTASGEHEKSNVALYGATKSASDKVSPRDMVAAHTGMPVRQPPVVLRVWLAPYEDEDKDLHDQSYFYTVVSTGRWMIEANNTTLSNQYRPTYPLQRQGNAATDPVERDKTPLVQKSDYSNLSPGSSGNFQPSQGAAEKPEYQGQ